MEALILLGGLLYIALLGLWLTGKLDRFLDRGGSPPAPKPPASAAAPAKKRARRRLHGSRAPARP